jgi:putative ABC transport system permease protein
MINKPNSNSVPPILKLIYRIPGMVRLILRRDQYHIGLTILALFGIVLAVGLVTNASFFTTAVDQVILQQELQDYSLMTGRPPFSTNVYVFPFSSTPVTLESAERLKSEIANILSAEVGLPVRYAGLQVTSGSMMLSPGADSSQYGDNFLGSVEVDYLEDISDQMVIDAGAPLDQDGVSLDVMQVWVHNRLAQEMGIQVGEDFIIRLNLLTQPITVRIAGFWHAKDPKNVIWFNDPDSALKNAFLVRRVDYIKFFQPTLASGSGKASWYIILDERNIIPKDGSVYLNGFTRAQIQIGKIIPNVHLNAPPLDPLKSFVKRSQALTVLLLAYNIPAFSILLYFLALISAIIAQWQQKETAILVSRGMSNAGVLSLTILEQLLLFLIGYPFGIAFGMLVARLMGYTATFLTFTTRPPLPVSLQGLSIPLTILALGVSLLARVWPVFQATRHSVVLEEREWARPMRGPFWYRYFLDFLLIIPTFYAYNQMAKRGFLTGLIPSGTGGSIRPEDLYRDPLLILIPALFVITASLVTMRLFALVMRIIDYLSSLTPWLTLHLVLRQLGRQSYEYIQPLLLVIISLAMGVYTISMAASLDQWLIDRIYYQVGTDLTFTPMPNVEGVDYSDGSWIPPASEFLKVEGIENATDVGHYGVRIELQSGEIPNMHFMAIDRVEFPTVAWYRNDFAREPLGALMNRLAVKPDGVLVPESILEEAGLQVGDPVPLIISVEDLFTIETTFSIAGAYKYFPTVYYTDGITLIGNMDYLESQIGFSLPHDIWLKLKPSADVKTVLQLLPGSVGITAYPERTNDARALIAAEQSKMERVGIFGTLSTGFLATAIMAILGLLIYSYASLRERVFRFAVLNAIGLLRRQIIAQVVMEYAFLAVFGALAGSLIGAIASELFVPFFQYTGEISISLPPLLPVISAVQMRDLGILFTLMIVLVEVITITWALRRKLVTIK